MSCCCDDTQVADGDAVRGATKGEAALGHSEQRLGDDLEQKVHVHVRLCGAGESTPCARSTPDPDADAAECHGRRTMPNELIIIG